MLILILGISERQGLDNQSTVLCHVRSFDFAKQSTGPLVKPMSCESQTGKISKKPRPKVSTGCTSISQDQSNDDAEKFVK